MKGINCTTGKHLDGIDHLRQSIRDILTTPLGSRVMRPEYGTDIFTLIDSPITGEFAIDVFIAVAGALDRWEPRFRLSNIKMTTDKNNTGHFTIDLSGEYILENKSLVVEEIQV